MKCFESSQGVNVVLDFFKKIPKKDQAKISKALKILDEDKINKEKFLYTELLIRPIWKLKVLSYRVYYIHKDDDIYILHISKKKSGKIHPKDKKIVLKRYRSI